MDVIYCWSRVSTTEALVLENFCFPFSHRDLDIQFFFVLVMSNLYKIQLNSIGTPAVIPLILSYCLYYLDTGSDLCRGDGNDRHFRGKCHKAC
jgi:hypothetical protein